MSCYRRLKVPGGTYYFHLRLADPGASLLADRIALLRDSVRSVRAGLPFEIDTAVVLPAELHMIWRLPPGDADFPTRWRLIKSTFSRHLPAAPERRRSLLSKGEKGIWQRRYWEHLIRDASDHAAHRQHCWTAPVRAGLVARPEDWPYSSIHRSEAVATSGQFSVVLPA